MPEAKGTVADVGGQGEIINIEAIFAAIGQHILAKGHFHASSVSKFVSGQMACPNASLVAFSAAV